ncbi:MAG: phosphate ABC transporter permease PstA [Desulfovibrio sp.]|jgi:phosphate transport system permease protein|nr:phosphate ABC transporter permease PstA [Desulfovibrio sp.]
MPDFMKMRRMRENLMFSMLRLAALVNVFALFSVCAFLVWNGLSALSWDFLTEVPRNSMTEGGILPCITGTTLLALGSLAVSFPLGVASAVYMHEYAGGSPFARYIRLGVNNLAGVPSIVFGLFGMSFFVIACGFGISLLSGLLTLAVLTLPIIIGTSEEALRQVPVTLREASFALGATQSRTIMSVVLPAALPGMLTGGILGLSRAAGETAAIMFTGVVFFSRQEVDSIFSPVMALSNHIYVLASSGTEIDKTRPLQYGTALVLVLLVLGMNFVAVVLRDHLQKRRGQ